MKFGRNIIIWIAAFIFLSVILGWAENQKRNGHQETVAYSDFMQNVKNKRVINVTIRGAEISGQNSDGVKFVTYAPYSPSTVETLLDNGVKVDAEPQDTSGETFWSILISWFPMVFLIGVWIFFMRQASAGNNKAMSFGKSRARLHDCRPFANPSHPDNAA